MKIENKENFPIELLDLDDETYQGRLSYDEEKVKNLAKDIGRFGQREPIGIRSSRTNKGKFQIIYGFQRVKALLVISRQVIKAAIYEDLTEREYRELSVRDNEMHGDLTEAEKAFQCKKLKEEGWSVEELCEGFNTKKSAVYNWLKVTELDEITVGLLHEGHLSIYQGLELGKEKDFSRRLEIINYCVTRNWSVRDIRRWITERRSPVMCVGVNGWIKLCPDGPSWKTIEQCKKCKYHKGKDGRHVFCDALDHIEHGSAMIDFITAYNKHTS